MAESLESFEEPSTFAALGRGKTHKGVRMRWQAGEDEGGESCRWAWDMTHLDAVLQACANQDVARIGDERCAGIRDQDDRAAVLESVENPG